MATCPQSSQSRQKPGPTPPQSEQADGLTPAFAGDAKWVWLKLLKFTFESDSYHLTLPLLGAATNTLTGGHPMTKYLHTMIRVSSLEDTIAFLEVLGLREIRRRPDEKGRYTNVFLAAPGDEVAAVELTYNWDPESYTGGRFRTSRICRGQHLRDLRRLYRPRRDDQPPAP